MQNIPGRTSILEYCCSCLVGRRTIGCCAHTIDSAVTDEEAQYERDQSGTTINDSENFKWMEDILPIGREHFTVNSGNVQAVTKEETAITIAKIMEFFISDEIIDYMVEKTNAYAELFKRLHT